MGVGVNNNLIPAKPGEVRNPKGRGKGVPNRKTILNHLLFEADVNNLGIVKNPPSWWATVRPQTLYEVTVVSMAIRAAQGDVAAFNAINKALGKDDTNTPTYEDVVHIYTPEKLTVEELNAEGDSLRRRHEQQLLKDLALSSKI